MSVTKTSDITDKDTVQWLVQEFLRYQFSEELPPAARERPFLLGIIGNIGSGKTMFSRLLRERCDGAVHVQANSARWLLRKHGFSWGRNVQAVLRPVIAHFLRSNRSIIVDGCTRTERNRDALAGLACENGFVRCRFVRLLADLDTCVRRTRRKYDDAAWKSSFHECRVNSTERMLENAELLAPEHDALQEAAIRGILITVGNNYHRSMSELGTTADVIASSLQ